MRDFRRCSICDEYGFLSGQFADHKCKPAFECRMEWNADGDEEGWERVHASDPEEAAEKYAERYDCEGGEYVIVGGRSRKDPIVQVRRAREYDDDDTIPVERWAVEGETVPRYYASKVEEEPATQSANT